MRMLAAIALMCTGCAYGVSDDIKSDRKPDVVTMSAPLPRPSEPKRVRVCEIVETIEIRDCTLFKLMCEDGEDMVLLCRTRPFDRTPEEIPEPYER